MAKPGHIYHWKHGWIPITPRAAMIKAKGSHSLGARYMKRYGVEDHRTGPSERRTERTGEGPAGRGSFVYRKGTKTRDYPDRAPSGSTPETKDIHPDVAFRMKRTELETHAKAGSKTAQAELDRRAAKKGGVPATKKAEAPKAEKPAAPKAAPAPKVENHPEAPKRTPQKPLAEADDRELANEVFRRGGVVTTKGRFLGGMANRTGTLPPHRPDLEWHSDEDIAKELHRRGVSVTVDGEPKSSTWTTGVNEPDNDKNPEARVKAARDAYGVDSPEHKAALEEQDRYINAGLGLWPSAGPGHRVKSRVGFNYSHTWDPEQGRYISKRTPTVVSEHRDSNGEGAFAYRALGHVTENEDGTFTATRYSYTPKKRQQREHPVGYNGKGEKGKVFDSREEAHKALATEHTIAQTKATEAGRKAEAKKAVAEAEKRKLVEAEAGVAAARRAENNRALAGLPGPGGSTWQAMDVPAPPPGAPLGVAEQLNKVSYRLHAGNAEVMIQGGISQEKAKVLLANVSSAMERIGPNLPEGKRVLFSVPEGLDYFARKPNVGAFVLAGDTTVNINPRMVSGAQWRDFEHSAEHGHFTPAAKGQHIQEFTLVHELGHVVDGQHAHTRPGLPQGNLNHDYTNVEFHRTTTRAGTTYAKDSPAEGYAEAFAQWTLGGKGSSAIADSYAERFGWKPAGVPSASHVRTRTDAEAAEVDRARRALADVREARRADAGAGSALDRRANPGKYQTATSVGRGAGGSSGFKADAASSMPAVGSTVHVGTDLRYLGKGTVRGHNPDGTALVEIPGMGTGRVAADQMFPTKAHAQANVKPMDGGGLAALGGNKVARRLAAQQRARR